MRGSYFCKEVSMHASRVLQQSYIIVVFLINVMKVISTVARVLQQPYIKSNAARLLVHSIEFCNNLIIVIKMQVITRILKMRGSYFCKGVTCKVSMYTVGFFNSLMIVMHVHECILYWKTA